MNSRLHCHSITVYGTVMYLLATKLVNMCIILYLSYLSGSVDYSVGRWIGSVESTWVHERRLVGRCATSVQVSKLLLT